MNEASFLVYRDQVLLIYFSCSAVLVHTLGALVVWVPTTNLPHLSSTHDDDDRGAFTMMRDLIIAQRYVSIRSCSVTTL